MRCAAVRRLIAATFAAGLAAGLVAVPVEPVSADPADTRMLLLLDSSGSMKEPDASGATKIDAAKKALRTVVDRLPPQAQIGLRVYGATPLSASDPRACTDTKLVVPVGPADTTALKNAIGGYRPAGETPIAYSLRKAAADLGPSGERTILLVSDGEESCKADPCAVAKALHRSGINLKIDVVGLHVKAAAKRQLACIAKEGGGTYYDARDADQLTATLNQSALRAFKDFTVTGTPVRGTPELSEAPEIGPGQYTDTIAQPGQLEGRTKHYVIRRTPGATLHAALTARPAKRTGGATSSDQLKLLLLTPAGEECTWASEAAFEWNATRDFLNTSVFFGPHANSSQRSSPPEECFSADRLVLRVERAERRADSVGAEDPVELAIIEEPPVDGAEALPGPVEAAEPVALAPSASRGEAVGGGGFHDAVALTPGTWSGTLQPGERLFYRVRVDWGQSVSATFRFLENPLAAAQFGQCAGNTPIAMRVYAPDRAPISLPSGTGVRTGTTRCFSKEQILATTLPEVRFRNREQTDEYVGPVALAGDYYFSIQQNANDDRRYQDPIQVTIAVDGERAGVPAYQGPDPAASAPSEAAGAGPSAESSQRPGGRANTILTSGVTVVALAGGLLVGIAMTVLLIVYLFRSHRRAGPPTP